MDKDKKNENIKVLEKAIIIFDWLKKSNRPLGVNEIAKHCSVNITTSFRILKTFKNMGWLYQDKNNKYIVGHKALFLANAYNSYLALKEISYYTMARLSAMASQAMNLMVRENEKCFILQQTRTDKIVDYVPPIGTIIPIYASAGGKILLAEAPEYVRDQILDKTELKPLTKHTITRRTALLEELEKIKRMGYAVDAHESQEGGFCVAVPVHNEEGKTIAALSFSGYIGKMSENEIKHYYQMLKQGSKEITGNLYKYNDMIHD